MLNKKMKILRLIAFVLVIVGAINWGLVGAFGFDLVASVFGATSMAAKVVYILVGLSGVMMVLRIGKNS